jgi:hypothetical protein
MVAHNCRARLYEFEKVVDANLTSFDGLVSEIMDKFPSGYGDLVRLFYFCMDRKVNIQVFNDQDLVDMFAKHKLLKCCSLTISYHHPSTDPPEIPDWECGSSVQSIEPPLTTTQPSHNIHNEPGEEESCPGSFFLSLITT